MKRMAIVYAVAAAAVLASVAAAGLPESIAVAQDGQVLVDGKAVARGGAPAWSPNGTQLAYVRRGQLYVADSDGRGERRLTTGRNVSFPAWTPDGKRVLFGDVLDLFSVPVTGGTAKRLTRSTKPWLLNVTPAVSPDGRTIAFGRATDAYNADIFLMNADGTAPRRLTRSQGTHDTLGEEMMPTWSPDGRRLVFVSNRDGNFELYSIDRDGANERRLTRTPKVNEENPRLSANGKRVLFVHDGRVSSMNLDGTGVVRHGRGTAADWR
jgi:Tol biopolymer transport system component